MKNKFLFALALTSVIVPLASCGQAKSIIPDAKLKETKTYNVYVKSPDKVDETVDISYFTENSEIGFISLTNAFKLYKQLRADYFDDPDWDYEISTISKENENLIKKVTNKYNDSSFTINTESDSVTFSSLKDFIVENGNIAGSPVSSYGTLPNSDSTSINLIAWANPNGMQVNYQQKLGSEEKTYNLGSYNIPIYTYDDDAYLPLATFSDLFCGQLYMPLSILKNGIYNVTECKAMAEAIKDQGLEVTSNLLKFNYNEVCFTLDSFYGFSEERVGRDFTSYFKNNGLEELFLESANGADKALDTVITTLMDDGHTNFLAASPSDTETFTPSLGNEMASALVNHFKFNNLRAESYPEGVPAYEEIGKTAIITFDSFDAEPNDLYKTGVPTSLDDAKDNAVKLFAYAYAQITRDGSPIENIIVDDANNGGGDARTGAWIGGILCGGSVNHYTRETTTGTLVSCRTASDVNLDGKFDVNDQLLSQKKIYVLTSKNSFSCGNMLPNFMSQNPNAYVVGQRSGGGSNVVLMGSTALGTAYRMSGNTQLCRWKNATFTNIDDGIEVNIEVSPERMYTNHRADLLSDLGLD